MLLYLLARFPAYTLATLLAEDMELIRMVRRTNAEGPADG
jgi:hypothetical protein